MNRFSFHETDFLARDLAQLQHQSNVNVGLPENSTSPAAPITDSHFPGIVLLYDDRPCAAIGYTREPCATIMISQPVLLIDAHDRIRNDLYDLLLKRIRRRSVANGVLRMNCLQQDSFDDDVFMRLLAKHEFIQLAEIHQWERCVGNGDAECETKKLARHIESRASEFSVQRDEFVKANTDEAIEVQAALDAILRCSNDLASQPQPRAAELLAKWRAMNAIVFVCRIEGNVAAILSCIESTVADSIIEIADAGDLACSVLSESHVCIEYIGVVAEFRRRQVATWLIGQIPVLLRPNGDGVRSANARSVKTIKAFADAANAPATGLYRECGFVLAAKMHLWCCDLRSEPNGNMISTEN